jgi:arginyl-tRNA synthetase
LQKTIKKIIEQKLDENIVLEKPKDRFLGHFATPVAFSLAKKLRKNPINIAQDLALKFQNVDTFESVQAVKGFVNFKLSNDFLSKNLDEALNLDFDFAKPKQNKNEKILIEYVSAHPTGPLHIGHARGAFLGDTLCRIGRYLKYDMASEYIVNDAGNQMNLLAISVDLANREFLLKQDVNYPSEYYRGDYLIDIAKKCQNITQKDEIISIAKDEVLKLIKDTLDSVDVQIDNYVSEKSLYKKWDDIKKTLETNGAIYTKDGKQWLKSTDFKDDIDRVVIRDNNVPTYLAGDIIYHKDKYNRNFDRYINIWGADHHGYIKRVKAGIEFLGDDSNKLEIILSQMVSILKDGEPYKMSKRAGNVILMSDIIDELGKDSLRFIFLTKKSDAHLEFDIDTLKAQDNTNPIFYINYAHARINQLFKKANLSFDDLKNIKTNSANENTKDLIYEALLLPSVLEDAFEKRDTQKITDYLQTLIT